MERLAPPYIGIRMATSSFLKIANTLPCPTYKNSLRSTFTEASVAIVWKMDGVIKSAKQWRWINSIKHFLHVKLPIPFEWVDEFYIHEYTEASGAVYSLNELSKAFDEQQLVYPDLFFTKDRKKLYRHIAMYASKLNYQGIMHVEGVFAGALLLNKHIVSVKTFSERDIWGKAKSIVEHIRSNPEKYKPKLSAKQLKGALVKGGKVRASQKQNEADKNRKKVYELMMQTDYQKANGKPKVSLIADALGLRRETVSRILAVQYTHKAIA